LNTSNKNTLRNYTLAWDYFCNKLEMTPEQISELAPSEINRIIDTVISGEQSWTNRTKKLYISGIRSILDFEYNIVLPKSKVRKHLKDSNELRTNKGELESKDIQKLLKYFESEYSEEKNNLDKITKLRNLILFKLLAGTGQRVSDLLLLTVKEAKKSTLTFIQSKTNSMARMDNSALSEILLYVSVQKLIDSDYLFANGLQRLPLHRTQAHRIISDAGKLVLQIPNLSCHWFRAYFVTELKKKKISNYEIMSGSGHLTESMIKYYYTGESELKNSVKLLFGE